jgi:hypothetical protein
VTTGFLIWIAFMVIVGCILIGLIGVEKSRK